MRRRDLIKEKRLFTFRYFHRVNGVDDGCAHPARHQEHEHHISKSSSEKGHYVGDGHHHGEVKGHDHEETHSAQESHHSEHAHPHDHFMGCCGTGKPKGEQNIAAFKANILKETGKNQSASTKQENTKFTQSDPQLAKQASQNFNKGNAFQSLLSNKTADFSAGFKMAHLFKGNPQQKFESPSATQKEKTNLLAQEKQNETSKASLKSKQEKTDHPQSLEKKLTTENPENSEASSTQTDSMTQQFQVDQNSSDQTHLVLREMSVQNLFASLASKVQSAQLARLFQNLSSELTAAFSKFLGQTLPGPLAAELKPLLNLRNGTDFSKNAEVQFLKLLAQHLMKMPFIHDNKTLMMELAVLIGMLHMEEEKDELEEEWMLEVLGEEKNINSHLG